MTPCEQFKSDCSKEIESMSNDVQLSDLTRKWVNKANSHKYSYHFEWLGRPVIQYPQDIVAMQEIIWKVQPDLIIETGIAHGGSLIFSASMLSLLDVCGVGSMESSRKVLGIDIDIREHNLREIESHPLRNKIEMIEGSSVDASIIGKVREIASKYSKVLVCLDSNHTHSHVLVELEAYAPLVTPGSYCVVFDTIIEDLPEDSFPDRPWSKGDNAKTAVWEFLEKNNNFQVDKTIENKLQISVAPEGYLKRIS